MSSIDARHSSHNILKIRLAALFFIYKYSRSSEWLLVFVAKGLTGKTISKIKGMQISRTQQASGAEIGNELKGFGYKIGIIIQMQHSYPSPSMIQHNSSTEQIYTTEQQYIKHTHDPRN